MQTTTTMCYHYVSIRMTKIQNSDATKCWWRCRETGLFTYYRLDVKWNHHSGKQLWQKNTKGTTTMQLINCIPERLPYKNKTLHTHVHTQIHCTHRHLEQLICSKLETTQMFFREWMLHNLWLHLLSWNTIWQLKAMACWYMQQLVKFPENYMDWNKPYQKVTYCVISFILQYWNDKIAEAGTV